MQVVWRQISIHLFIKLMDESKILEQYGYAINFPGNEKTIGIMIDLLICL